MELLFVQAHVGLFGMVANKMSILYGDDHLLGENGFAITTWTFCGRCGKRLKGKKQMIGGFCSSCIRQTAPANDKQKDAVTIVIGGIPGKMEQVDMFLDDCLSGEYEYEYTPPGEHAYPINYHLGRY